MKRSRVVRVAASEGAANVRSAPARSLLLALVAVLLAGSVVALSASELAGITTRYRKQVVAGRFVLVARSPSRDGLDAGRCEALRDLPGVRSAGAVLGQETVFPLAAPLRPYDQLAVTPGLPSVWFPDLGLEPRRGLLVGADAADELGLVAGAVFQGASSPGRTQDEVDADDVARTRVIRVAPSSTRNPEAARMIFEVRAPTGRASACFVDPDPSARASVEAALVGWFGSEQPASVSPYIDEQLSGRSPEAELAGRTTRWVWLAAAVALALLTWVLWYGRREEFALYRLLGLRRGALTVVLLTESALTLAVPSLVGGSLALVASRANLAILERSTHGTPSLTSLLAADVAAFAVALAVVPLVGLVAATGRSTFEVLKGF